MKPDLDPDRNLHSPQRQLIELRIEHADLDSLIDRLIDSTVGHALGDDLLLRRFKKRRLRLRDQIVQLEVELDPPLPA
jgi:hypothetical protein